MVTGRVVSDGLRGVRLVILDKDLRSFVQLLSLHPPVLEPHLHLALRQVQLAGDLPPFLPCDVRVRYEFVFQYHRLVSRVRLPFLSLSRLVRIMRADVTDE